MKNNPEGGKGMDNDFANQKIQEWYHLYSDEIYRFIFILTSDHELAKDLMHDTFLKSFYGIDSYQGRSSVKNWLYRIARNVTIDYKRKTRPISFYLNEWNLMRADERNCPQRIMALGEAETHLYQALNNLKHNYKEVLILRKLKELSIQETAEILDWSEGKVKITLFRAQQALKRQMEKEGYEHEEVYSRK